MNRKDYFDTANIIFYLFVILILVGFLLGTFTYISRWGGYVSERTSPQSLEQKSKIVNGYYEALKTSQITYQSRVSHVQEYIALYGTDTSKWPYGKRDEYQDAKQLANEAMIAYNNTCSQYNALWQNEWKTWDAPKDIPTSCTLINPN